MGEIVIRGYNWRWTIQYRTIIGIEILKCLWGIGVGIRGFATRNSTIGHMVAWTGRGSYRVVYLCAVYEVSYKLMYFPVRALVQRLFNSDVLSWTSWSFYMWISTWNMMSPELRIDIRYDVINPYGLWYWTDPDKVGWFREWCWWVSSNHASIQFYFQGTEEGWAHVWKESEVDLNNSLGCPTIV